MTETTIGTVSRIAGSHVTAKGMPNAKMFELVKVGEAGIIGEIIVQRTHIRCIIINE